LTTNPQKINKTHDVCIQAKMGEFRQILFFVMLMRKCF